MSKIDKTNNGLLVGISIGIVLTLLIVGALFATNIITFKTSVNNDTKKTNNTNDIENSNNIANSNQIENNSIQDDVLGKNDTFSMTNESGIVEVLGYTEVKEIIDEMDTGEKYNYVFFHIIDTKSEEFKKYIESLSGNSFALDDAIGIGCLIDDKISYSNSSDQAKLTQYEISVDDTKKIMNSTKENPIKLKLERLPLTYGSWAPICYSHITTISIED